jgi:hypothetical protein
MHPISHLAALAIFCALLSIQTTRASAQDIAKYSPSFIKGILEGCIDGQKKALRTQGVDYPPNEELVRQYCHCMAPTTADISFTNEGRQKLLAGDPGIKKQVQKAEAICLDGVKNGRKFAPPLAAAPPYSSQENAYGRIVGTYWSALSVMEVCLEYKSLRTEAQAASKSYTASNRPLYDRTGKRMLELARENGGTIAAEKLQAEVHQMTSNKAEMLSEVRKTASSEAMCSTMLRNLRAGQWDIARRHPRELSMILGN